MNHTNVDLNSLCQKVKDEVSLVLDSTDIGIDDMFIVIATETYPKPRFALMSGFYRVPCTLGKVYIKKYVSRDSYVPYGLAYESEYTAGGRKVGKFIRVIKLKVQRQERELFSFVVDPNTNMVDVHDIANGTTFTVQGANDSDIRIVYEGATNSADIQYEPVMYSYGTPTTGAGTFHGAWNWNAL